MKEVMTNHLLTIEAKDDFYVALRLFKDDPLHIQETISKLI